MLKKNKMTNELNSNIPDVTYPHMVSVEVITYHILFLI